MHTKQGIISSYRPNRINISLAFSFSDFTWQLTKDFIIIIILFTFSVLAVYKVPQVFSKIFFLFLLVIFWFSGKDYLWFAFFFILIQGPGWLFSDFYSSALHRIPMYNILPGFSFSALDLFVILAFIKALLKGKRTKLELEKPLILILFYVVFSIFVGIIYGTTIETFSNMSRGLFYYSLIISFLYLIQKRKEAYNFIFLITPFVFFIFFTQIYFLITRNEFINIFYPQIFRKLALIEGTQQVRPEMGGEALVFFGFIFSIFLMVNKENRISRKYLYLTSAIAFLSIILSATRFWLAVYSFILFGYILIEKKKITKLIKICLVLLALFIILAFSGIGSSNFFKGILGRLTQIVFIAQGRFQDVPTFAYRYYVRLPQLLVGIKKYPIFGCGFSETYLLYRDYHVGFLNTILQFGGVGFFLFIYFFTKYLNLIKKTLRKISTKNSLRTSIKTLSIFFGGILLAHFTVWYFFPIDGDTIRPFFIAIFISLTELFIREANQEELLLKQN